MEVTSTMNENTYQGQSEPDLQKLVLPGLQQPADASLYRAHTQELPEMPLTGSAIGYNKIAGASMGSSLPPTSSVYGFPPVDTALPHPMVAAPLPANSRMRAGRKLSVVRAIWWFALVGVVVTTAIVGTLFLPAVFAELNQQGVVASITPTALPTPTMVQPTPTPTPVSKTLNNITFTPSQFLLTADCHTDNGYRCTLTLQASAALQTRTSWSVTAQPKTSIQLNQRQGTLRRGQQAQLIIFVKGTCLYQGSLLFTVKGGHLTVPLSC